MIRIDLSTKKRRENGNSEHTPPPYSPYIAAVITDFSDELNDSTHVYPMSHKPCDCGKHPDSRSKPSPSFCTKPNASPGPTRASKVYGTINNKMAYFFKTVRDLCR